MSTYHIHVTLCAFEERDEFQHLPGYVVEAATVDDALDKVYVHHQNGIGPSRSSDLKVRSLSVGDLITVGEDIFIVIGSGFKQLTKEQMVAWLALEDSRDRSFCAIKLIGLVA